MSLSFGATCALSDVSLSFEAGEVHVIAGGNGAGKSTLIKIVSGAYGDYAGELFLDGRLVRFADPLSARRAGIATIYQELSLLPALSIAENFELSRPGAWFGAVSQRESLRRARQALRRVGLELDPRTLVEELGLSERQLLEIARALAEDARVLVMDEPTSALSEPEVERLFTVVRELLARDKSVIFISHRRDEVERFGQRVSVLRDGKLVLSAPRSRISHGELIQAMVGESLDALADEAPATPESRAPSLCVQALTATRLEALRDVSFEAHTHEILGLAGLGGSGAALLLALLGGQARAESGRILLFGETYAPLDPRSAQRVGVVHLPADRKHSVFSELSVAWNATLSALHHYSRHEWVLRERERFALSTYAAKTRLKAENWQAPAGTLSGGNQQKVALLRCLLAKPRVLLLDDPTRGVDARAKADIAALLRELAAQGVCVLLLSSELDELVSLCDRALVFCEGRIVTELSRGELSRERLLRAMLGAA